MQYSAVVPLPPRLGCPVTHADSSCGCHERLNQLDFFTSTFPFQLISIAGKYIMDYSQDPLNPGLTMQVGGRFRRVGQAGGHVTGR